MTRRFLVLFLAAGALAAAPAGTLVEGNHVRARMPAGWKANPDAAAAMKKGLGSKPGMVADVAAWGDAPAGVTGVLVWLDMSEPFPGNVRATLGAFVTGVLKSLPADERQDQDTRYHRVVRTGTTGKSDTNGIVAAVIDMGGHLHGYTLMCVRTGGATLKARAKAACDALLGSFELTWADAELKPLEKP
jgi:hypothetical protein